MSVTDLPRSRNGVNVEALFATLDAVRAQPEIARFQFRSAHRWVSGTHNQGTIHGFYGAGQELQHQRETRIDADHPAVLVGADNGPTPAELLLNALGACLMSGLANIAAARGIDLDEVTATVEGDINVLGILGLDDEVRNGYEAIRVVFHVKGDAEAAKLAEVVQQSRKRSAVFDVVTNGVPVSVDVATA
ncbi:MAG TPA: OsmC family protein [Actinomycetes bacterium]